MNTKNGVLTCLGYSYLFSVSQVQGDKGDTIKPFESPFRRMKCVLRTENQQWQNMLCVC